MRVKLQVQTLHRNLRRKFGFKTLREGQEEVIRSILSGQDTLAIMPTGAGKSLCYQLAGSELPGTTLIVSPLLSLMKDQVDKLEEIGMTAAEVNSSLSAAEESRVIEEIEGRQSEFIFVTPERLARPDFLETLKTNRIGLFVIDEAHCISQWGHDFRPAYLRLREAIAELGDPPVLALTATATREVAEDILEQLGREEMEIIDTGIFRDNLRFSVIPANGDAAKREHVARILRESVGTGIVYTSTVRDCEAVTAYLLSLGLAVEAYHGRLAHRARRRAQDRFMAGELAAIVATNAFGMGIDKPDIRFVVHYNLPGSLESYYQEAGRAGRDGETAECVLLYQPEDRNTQLFFLNGKYPRPEHFAAVYRSLEKLDAAHRAVGAAEVERHADVASTKVRVVLAAMKDLELVDEPEAGRFRLLRAGIVAAELAELAHRYEERGERDRDRLRSMVHYAQTALCRWQVLASYFNDELGVPCSHCDNCSRPSLRPPVLRPELPPRGVAAWGAVPLPPLLGGLDLANLKTGDVLSLPMYGRGEVRSVDGPSLVLALADGEVREFRASP
jgi:ATP-dependent DNA helicase RecQ